MGFALTISAILLAGYLIYIKNRSLQKQQRPDHNKRRIACIGDSITFGHGVIPFNKTRSWPALLDKKLYEEFQVLNYGICGATLLAEGDRPYSKDYYQSAKIAKPEMVILMLGTNDSKAQNWNRENYNTQIRQWVDDILKWENVKHLVLMIPPYACPYKGKKEIAFGISQDILFNQIRPDLQQLAKEKPIELIDLMELTYGHDEYYMDGVHPNKKGNEVIADEVLKTIDNILNR